MSALNPQEELRHLREGVDGAAVPAGFQLDRLDLGASNPAVALAGAREVMEAVLARSDGPWPPLAEWQWVLPDWFVERCVDDSAIQTCTLDRWSLRAWLYWLEPSNRRWWWWDATARPKAVRVLVVYREKPYLRGALEWLFKAADR